MAPATPPSSQAAPPTRTPLPPPPPPKTPSTPAPPQFDQQAMKFIIDAFSQSLNRQRVYPIPVKPRVGGVNEIGAWTGLGAGKKGLNPRSKDCMRKFRMDPSKDYQQMSLVETECRKGLAGTGKSLFCMTDEPDAKNIVTTLQNMEEDLEMKGLEGVFVIVKQDGTQINMLRQPGMYTEQDMRTWINDLTVDGVHDGKGGRLPVCPYDVTNLDWGYDAIRNTQSAKMAKHQQNTLSPADYHGPGILFAITQLLYKHSESKVQKLLDKIQALDIKKYPGENVTLLAVDLLDLLQQLEMNVMPGASVDTLKTKVLKPFTRSSLEFFKSKAMEIDMQTSNSKTNTIEGVKNVIKSLEAIYTTMMEKEHYAPGLQAIKTTENTVKALQAQIVKLTRDQGSSASNSGTGGSGNSNWKADIICYVCGRKGHISKDPECPENQKSNSNGQTTAPAGVLKNGKYSNNDKKVKIDKNLPSANGLDADTNSAISKLIKEKQKTMPSKLKDIPKDAVYEVELNGKVVAKHCRKCGRFTRGNKMHSTAEHKPRGKMLVAKQKPQLESVPQPPPLADHSAVPVCVPIPPPVSYEFGSMERVSIYDPPTHQQTLLPPDDDDASFASVDNRLLAVLSRAPPKGPSRQV